MENEIKNWIKIISEQERIPDDINGLYIGIFEIENGYSVYMIGSKKFNSENGDWASDKDFEPKQKYIEFKGDNIKSLGWEKFQDKVIKALKDILSLEAKDILHKAPHVSVGFDDGDLINLK